MRPTPTTPTLDHLELPKGAEPPSRYRVQLDEKCLCSVLRATAARWARWNAGAAFAVTIRAILLNHFASVEGGF